MSKLYKDCGLGKSLIVDALIRLVRSELAVYALIVEAKNEVAVSFYRHFGFTQFPDQPSKLFLPMKTAEKLLKG